MTKVQQQLYDKLLDINRKSAEMLTPHMVDPEDALQRFCAQISPDTATAFLLAFDSGEISDAYEKDVKRTKDETTLLWYSLWYLLFMDEPITSDRLRDFDELLSRFTVISQRFYRAAQNRITNALPTLFKTSMQLDLDGSMTGSVGTRKDNKVFFVVENAADHELSTTAKMLLDVFLIKYSETHALCCRVPLKQYATMRGLDTNKNALDSLRRQVAKDLDTLGDIKAAYYERRRGRLEYSGFMRLNGGTGIIENGVIIWNWNADLLPSLEAWAPIDYSKETLSADPRTSAYYFSRYIDVNYRRNEGKPSSTKIYISTLLATTPNIPDIDLLQSQRGNVRDRVIGRFFRDLDSLERVLYDVYTKDGQLVDDPLSMSIEDFREGYIVIDYSDYPAHPERLIHRGKRAKKSKNAT